MVEATASIDLRSALEVPRVTGHYETTAHRLPSTVQNDPSVDWSPAPAMAAAFSMARSSVPRWLRS